MRTEPVTIGSELDQITQYLDFQRETVLGKTEGLGREQLLEVHPPSTLTLAGLHADLLREAIDGTTGE